MFSRVYVFCCLLEPLCCYSQFSLMVPEAHARREKISHSDTKADRDHVVVHEEDLKTLVIFYRAWDLSIAIAIASSALADVSAIPVVTAQQDISEHAWSQGLTQLGTLIDSMVSDDGRRIIAAIDTKDLYQNIYSTTFEIVKNLDKTDKHSVDEIAMWSFAIALDLVISDRNIVQTIRDALDAEKQTDQIFARDNRYKQDVLIKLKKIFDQNNRPNPLNTQLKDFIESVISLFERGQGLNHHQDIKQQVAQNKKYSRTQGKYGEALSPSMRSCSNKAVIIKLKIRLKYPKK